MLFIRTYRSDNRTLSNNNNKNVIKISMQILAIKFDGVDISIWSRII